jgi:GxxExxY protein
VSQGFHPIHIETHEPGDQPRDPRTSPILGAALEVHRHLGAGLLESAYEECLCHELWLRGLRFHRQVDVPVESKGLKLSCGYKIDLLVQDEVILELKAVEKLLPIHQAQLLTYLKLAHKRVGLLINFKCPTLEPGHYPTSPVNRLSPQRPGVTKKPSTLQWKNGSLAAD